MAVHDPEWETLLAEPERNRITYICRVCMRQVTARIEPPQFPSAARH